MLLGPASRAPGVNYAARFLSDTGDAELIWETPPGQKPRITPLLASRSLSSLMPEEARCRTPGVARQVATRLSLRVDGASGSSLLRLEGGLDRLRHRCLRRWRGPLRSIRVLASATRDAWLECFSHLGGDRRDIFFSACIIIYLPELHRRLPLATITRLGALSRALGVITWSIAQAPWQLFAAALLTGVG
jgi:hypothetical protein